MNFKQIITDLQNEVKNFENTGKTANYIPELSKVSPSSLGFFLKTKNGDFFEFGESRENFSIQSISKVFSLAMAFSLLGEKIWNRVGVEPSGNAFNSIVQLELENGVPRNPFINAGALVVADILVSYLKNPKNDFLKFVQEISGNSKISFNEKVAQSEKENRYLNASLVNMMKSYGNIENDVDDVLNFYFYQCSVEMSTKDLANAFLHFSDHSKKFSFKKTFLSRSQIKRINSIMLSCGFYDESGEFAFRVGLPGKSGVGGGIAALQPNEFSVAVWSPKLNKKGNSLLGMQLLELLTTKTKISIF